MHSLPIAFGGLAVRLASVPGVSPSTVAQQPPVRTMPAPDAIFQDPFSVITTGTVRELGNGRVVVADTRDGIVKLIDFATNSAKEIGRDGSGPGEFRQPVSLFAASGDTTFFVDRGNQRLLVISPDGIPVSSFRIELMLGPGASAGNGRFFYAQGPTVLFGPSGPVPADTAPVIRFDRAQGTLDTVAWVHPPKLKMERTSSGGIRTGEANPLSPADTWMVFPDGRLAVVRAADYRVEFVHVNGRVTRGAPIPYSPIRITSADKDAEEARRNRARQSAGPGRSLLLADAAPQEKGRRPGATSTPLPPLTDWPEVKPPFLWTATILPRPNGELWVQRTQPAGAKGTLFDVINPQGVVTYRVRVPDEWTLVAFGNGTAYTVKRDADDLAYLQRHRLP
jgi:hypothetical protein